MSEGPADESVVLSAMDNPFFTPRLTEDFLRSMKADVIKLMAKDKRRVDIKTLQACFRVFEQRHNQEFIKML